jgi:hypothetical protein
VQKYSLIPGKLKEQHIKLDYKHKSAKGYFWTVGFKDHQFHVAYIPSLDLSGYGETEKDALDMLYNQVMDDFFVTLFQLNESQISAELEKYGWKRSKLLRKKFMNTPYVDKEGILKNFNLPAETPIKEQFVGV